MLLLLFFLYGFVGWVAEVIYGIVITGRFVNRGFLVGPICPIYGFGVVIITVLLSRYQNDLLVLWVMSMFVCSLLEYVTSYLMEKIFKTRWWDYSDKRYNINGRICLEFSFAFGLFAVLVLYFMNPVIYNVLDRIPNVYKMWTAIILLVVFIVDIIISFGVIITLKNVAASMKEDSTEVITKKVKDILVKKGTLFIRLLSSFPMAKISSAKSYIKDKLTAEKEKMKKKKEKQKQLEKEKRRLFK